jgi:hypothetical protein
MPSAKNVCLAGVNTVCLHDNEAVAIADLSSQFYLSDANVGANRAASCVDKLAELNSSVRVSSSSAELTDEFLSSFSVRKAPPIRIMTPSGRRRHVRPHLVARPDQRALPRARHQIYLRRRQGLLRQHLQRLRPQIHRPRRRRRGAPKHGHLLHHQRRRRPRLPRRGRGSPPSPPHQLNSAQVMDVDDGSFVTFNEVQGMVELNDGTPRRYPPPPPQPSNASA